MNDTRKYHRLIYLSHLIPHLFYGIYHKVKPFVSYIARPLFPNRLQPDSINRNDGLILPFFTGIMNIVSNFTLISLCNYLFRRNRPYNQRFVDLYIILWSIFIISTCIYLDCLYRANPHLAEHNIPIVLKHTIIAFCAWRIIDILQAWYYVLLGPNYRGNPRRTIFLTLWNYVETTILFGIIGYLIKSPTHILKDLGSIQIIDAIRYSFGIITPLGITDIPDSFREGYLFYPEYLVGLFFLIVIISRAVSLFPNKGKPVED